MSKKDSKKVRTWLNKYNHFYPKLHKKLYKTGSRNGPPPKRGPEPPTRGPEAPRTAPEGTGRPVHRRWGGGVGAGTSGVTSTHEHHVDYDVWSPEVETSLNFLDDATGDRLIDLS